MKIETNVKFVKNPSIINVDGLEYIVINDIDEAVEHLKHGVQLARFERGNSLSPVLRSGEYGVVTPYVNQEIKVGDVVLCKVGEYIMTHMIMMVSDASKNGKKYLIGNTWMEFYGWTDEIYGIVKGTNVFEEE